MFLGAVLSFALLKPPSAGLVDGVGTFFASDTTAVNINANTARSPLASEHVSWRCSPRNRQLFDFSLRYFPTISREDVSAAGKAMLTGIEFVIFDGTPFVINEKPGFQSRNMAAKLLIFELAHTGMLGRMNAHFTIHTADSPVSPLPELCEVPFAGPWNDSCTQPRAPLNGAVLSHNRRAGFGDMLWPTWAFVGWPELHQPPHDFWPTKYQALLAAGAAAPWEARSNKALFAGTLLGGAQRKRAAEIAQDEASNLLVVHNMSNEEQCRHKYLLYLEGGSFIQCFSSRADYIFLCGSAVLFVSKLAGARRLRFELRPQKTR